MHPTGSSDASPALGRERVAPRRVDATSPVFRARVLQRHARGESVAEVLEVGGTSSWALCLSAAACVIVGAAGALWVPFEVTCRARGVFRPLDEIVTITAPTEGVVVEVQATAGQEVEPGAHLISMDSGVQLKDARGLVARTEVRAPLAGTVETILVRTGAQVAAASSIGRIVPRALSERVVVFVPERDRAFIRPGASVRLAIDQLPAAEFGWMNGRVERVAMAVAAPDEIRNVLGDDRTVDGARYRVDIALVDDARRHRLAPQLPVGAMLSAHIAVRTQTVAALALRPLREWIGP
jgi:multidrug resistance efflux pump